MTKTKNRRSKAISHEEMLDRFIGKRGTAKREQFEFEVELARIGHVVRELREKRNLTQVQLGELVGVQKAQISKIENNTGNMTLVSVMRVLSALKATVTFTVKA